MSWTLSAYFPALPEFCASFGMIRNTELKPAGTRVRHFGNNPFA